MQTLEAEYEIITPMFIGGADIHQAPEIRPPAIKGMLRFWWRALQWGQCLTANNQDKKEALAELQRQEAELFGAAAQENAYGQGKISLRIKNADQLIKTNVIDIKQKPCLAYLLGQGLYDFNKGVLRQSVSQNHKFTVILKLPDNLNTDSIIDALLIFGLLGGLGSRSRKGWGSVAIRSLKIFSNGIEQKSIAIPDDKETYKSKLHGLLNTLANELPPFSAFSKQTRIDISTKADQPINALEYIGREMQTYRSYGRKIGSEYKVNGKKAEQNFTTDHDIVFNFADGKATYQHPKRVLFGLPHNYFYSNKYKVEIETEHFQRRASPLMIHIHQFSTGESIGVHCLLKADFLPENEKIKLNDKTKNHKTPERNIDCTIDWTVMDKYLDRFNAKEQIL